MKKLAMKEPLRPPLEEIKKKKKKCEQPNSVRSMLLTFRPNWESLLNLESTLRLIIFLHSCLTRILSI